MVVIRCDICLREIPQHSQYKLIGDGTWFANGNPFTYIMGNGQFFCNACWKAMSDFTSTIRADRIASAQSELLSIPNSRG